MQRSNLLKVIGPLLMSMIATHFGWKWVPLLPGFSSVFAVPVSSNMRANTHSQPELIPTEVFH